MFLDIDTDLDLDKDWYNSSTFFTEQFLPPSKSLSQSLLFDRVVAPISIFDFDSNLDLDFDFWGG